MENQIKLVQVPVIQHKLVEVGANVTKRIEELNLSNLIATDETIKSLKDLRAELNKEFTDFEGQRKALKQAVTDPYMEFETVYNVEISTKYKQAVELLKDKIAAFENNVKAEKKASIELYFKELCDASKIDFLKFSDTGLEINLSTSEKQYKEKCAEFVNRVADDIILIQGIDYPVETMAEYKKTLNASKAITAIRERKEAERLEAERLKTIETDKRLAALRKLNMVYHDMTKTYNLVDDESVFILFSDIENLTKDDFLKRYVEINAEIKRINSEKETAEKQRLEALKSDSKEEVPIVVEKPKQAPAPLQSPIEVIPEKPVKKVMATFEVTGTMQQLMALKDFLVSNNYEYKNI